MDEASFDRAARDEINALEDAFADIDPDDVEVTTSDGVLRLDLRDGTRIVINSHRAARQIWMAADRRAWHFDYHRERQCWIASKSNEELWQTLQDALSSKLNRPIRLRAATLNV